jgi:hypothetical protein
VEEDNGVKLAKISVGPRQWLVYRETDNADEVRPDSTSRQSDRHSCSLNS